jgi:hypothetical protein
MILTIFRYLIELMPEFNECIDKMVDHFAILADGKTSFCLMNQFSRTTLDVLGKV